MAKRKKEKLYTVDEIRKATGLQNSVAGARINAIRNAQYQRQNDYLNQQAFNASRENKINEIKYRESLKEQEAKQNVWNKMSADDYKWDQFVSNQLEPTVQTPAAQANDAAWDSFAKSYKQMLTEGLLPGHTREQKQQALDNINTYYSDYMNRNGLPIKTHDQTAEAVKARNKRLENLNSYEGNKTYNQFTGQENTLKNFLANRKTFEENVQNGTISAGNDYTAMTPEQRTDYIFQQDEKRAENREALEAVPKRVEAAQDFNPKNAFDSVFNYVNDWDKKNEETIYNRASSTTAEKQNATTTYGNLVNTENERAENVRNKTEDVYLKGGLSPKLENETDDEYREYVYDLIMDGAETYQERIAKLKTPKAIAEFNSMIDQAIADMSNPEGMTQDEAIGEITALQGEQKHLTQLRNNAEAYNDKTSGLGYFDRIAEGITNVDGSYDPSLVDTQLYSMSLNSGEWAPAGSDMEGLPLTMQFPVGSDIDKKYYWANNTDAEYIDAAVGEAGEVVFMTDEQRAKFNKFYKQDRLDGTNTAQAYLDGLHPYLSAMKVKYEDYKYRELAEVPVLGEAMGLATVPVRLASGFVNDVAMIAGALGNEAAQDPTSDWFKMARASRSVRGQRQEVWDDRLQAMKLPEGWGRFLSGTGYSILDNLLTMFMSGAIGGGGLETQEAMNSAMRSVQFMMSSEAASDVYLESLEKNLSTEESVTRALGAGAIEWITERVTLENLLKPDMRDVIRGGGMEALKFLGKNVVAEGSEEGAADVMNLFMDNILSYVGKHETELEEQYWKLVDSGTDPNEASKQVLLGKLKETGLSMLGGAISGGVLGGGHLAGSVNSTAQIGAAVKNQSNTRDGKTGAARLVELGTNMKENSHTRNLAEGLKMKLESGESISNYELGKLANSISLDVGETQARVIEDTVQRTIRDQLLAQKVDRQEAGTMAEIIADSVMNDGKLTRAQRQALSTSEEALNLWQTYNSTQAEGILTRTELGLKIQNETKDQQSVRRTLTELTTNEQQAEGAIANEIRRSISETNSTEEAIDNLRTRRSNLISEEYAEAAKEILKTDPNAKENKHFLSDVMKVMLAAKSLNETIPETSLKAEDAQRLYDQARAEFDAEDENRIRSQARVEPGKGEAVFEGAEYGTEAFNQKMAQQNLSRREKNRIRMAGEIVTRLGLKTDLVYRPDMDNVFGMENPETGRIEINVAGRDANGTRHHMLVTLAHESTHWLEQNSRDGYRQLRKFILDSMRANGVNVEQRLIDIIDNEYYELNKNAKEGDAVADRLSINGAMAELVAQGCENLFTSETMRNELAKVNPTLFNQVKRYVKNFVERVRAAVADIVGSGSLSAEAMSLLNETEEIAKLWLGAREEALSRNQAQEAAEENKNTKPSYSVVNRQAAVREMTDTELNSNYMQAVKNNDVRAMQMYVDEAARRAGYTIRGDHGTVSKYFTIFDRSKGNVEGDWGSGFYFSNNMEDVAANYANEHGPDLEAKIERLVEKMAWMDGYQEMTVSERRAAARKMLAGGKLRVIHAAIRMTNPVVIGGQNETFFDFNVDYDEASDTVRSMDGKLVDFVNAMNAIMEEKYMGIDVSAWKIYDQAYANENRGMTAQELEQAAKELVAEITDSQWNYAGNEIVREAFERAGFDGIVDNTVGQKFGLTDKSGRKGMTGVNENTTHYIAFFPNQIKQTDPITRDDNGKVIPLSERFNPAQNDMRYSTRQETTSVAQSELEKDYNSVGKMWYMTPEETYRLASKYATEEANENNFYMNSVGFWDLRSRKPSGEPDYVSHDWRTGKETSRYWYTKEGVYRQSDHWGTDVASCSWYIKGRHYENEGIKKGNRETAFIKWSDLKAKGMISKHWQTGEYGLVGFKFRKDFTGDANMSQIQPSEDETIRYSVRQSPNADVTAWMMTLTPGMLQTEDERQLLSDYQGIMRNIDAVKNLRIREYENKIRTMESHMDQLTQEERNDLVALRNKLADAQARLDRYEQELYKITSKDGFANLMYENSQLLQRNVYGKTPTEIANMVEQMRSETLDARKALAEAQREIARMAQKQSVKDAEKALKQTGLDSIAKVLKTIYPTQMTRPELMARLTEIMLSLMTDNVSQESVDGRISALAYDMITAQDPLRSEMYGDVLKNFRGMTVTIGKTTMEQLKAQHISMNDLRSRMKGSGVRFVYNEHMTGAETLEDVGPDSEIRQDFPNMPENGSPVDNLLNFVDLYERAQENAKKEAEHFGDVDGAADTIRELTGELAEQLANDSETIENMRKLLGVSKEQATGRLAELAEKLGMAQSDLASAMTRGEKAAGMTRALQADMKTALEYYNQVAKAAAEESRTKVKERLIQQLKSETGEKLLKLNQEWQEKVEKDKKTREAAEGNMQLRKRVNLNYGRVANLLINETDRKNMPEHMKGLAREMLTMIARNDTSGRKITGTDRHILMDHLTAMNAMQELDGDFDVDDIRMIHDEEAQSMVFEALADLEEGIRDYNSSPGKTQLENLAHFHEALQKIDSAVATITGIINAERSVSFMDRQVAIADAAQDVVRGFTGSRFKGEWAGRGAKGVRAVNQGIVYGNMTPEYFIKNLRNKGMTALWNEFGRGENRYGLEGQKAKGYVEALQEKTNYSAWGDDKIKVTLGGITREITVQNAMALYATWKREQTTNPQMSEHLVKGGVFIETTVNQEGKLRREWTTQRPIRVTDGEIVGVYEKLTADQREWMEGIVSYLSNETSDLGNEASMRMYGIKKYKEKYYFPMKIWDGVRSARSDTGLSGVTDNRSTTRSWSKRRINRARNALVIGNFTEIAMQHVAEMVNYNTMGPAVENLNKVLNYQMTEGLTEEEQTKRNVRIAFQENYGKDALNYLETLMKDLNGGVVQDPRGTLKDKLLSVFRKNAVAGSLSVAFQQPLSYIRAAMMIDPKYLGMALNPKYYKGSYAEMMKYSGVAVIKSMGRFDMNFGQSLRDYITPETKKGAGGVIYDRAVKLTTGLPEKMDQMTWTRMWTAAKLEQAAANPGMDQGSDEFLQKVAERFNEVMRKTQVYDSVLVKSSNMRSKNIGMKAITSFMAEPTLTLNVLADAVRNVKEKGGKAKLATAAATYAVSAVFQAIVKAAFGSGRSPDEKKTWLENFLNKFQQNFISEINPISLIPGYSDLIELLKNGELKDDAMGVIGKFRDVWDTGNKIINGKGRTPWRDAEDTGGQIVQLFTNVPAKNVMRDLRAIYNWVTQEPYAKRDDSAAVIRHQADANWFSGDNFMGVLNSMLGEAGFQTKNSDYYRQIHEAEVAGNAEEAAEIREYLQLGKNVSDETIDKALNSMDYQELYDAMDGNKSDQIKAAVGRMTGRGKTVKDIKTQLTKKYKEQYLGADSDGKRKIRDAMQKAYKAMGLTAEDANKIIDKWK